MQYKLRVASGLNIPWYGSIEWNMEENFNMEWNMEYGMEENCPYEIWKNRLPFYSIPCPGKKNIALIFLYLTSHGLF